MPRPIASTGPIGYHLTHVAAMAGRLPHCVLLTSTARGGEDRGEAGPECSSCDPDGSCPAGYSPQELPRLAPTTDFDCYCLLEVDDCLAPDATCPEGTFCRVRVDELSGDTRVIDSQVCAPYGELAGETVWGNARFVNVPAGGYSARAASPTFDAVVHPMRMRVSPGVLITGNFQVQLE